MKTQKTVVEVQQLSKFFDGPNPFQVLKNISFSIQQGEFVSIVGKSGCGKSTLLYILSTMDTDYQGNLLLDGQSMRGLTDKDLSGIRNEKIGFVFQFHYLLDEFNVLKNVMLPGLKLGKWNREALEDRAMSYFKLLGMEDDALKMPRQLSGGMKQRVAIIRAMINQPLILMCDEPTGNLDKKNSDLVFDIFKELTTNKGQTMLVVTHDPDFAQRSDRIIEMSDGEIIADHQVKK